MAVSKSRLSYQLSALQKRGLHLLRCLSPMSSAWYINAVSSFFLGLLLCRLSHHLVGSHELQSIVCLLGHVLAPKDAGEDPSASARGTDASFGAGGTGGAGEEAGCNNGSYAGFGQVFAVGTKCFSNGGNVVPWMPMSMEVVNPCPPLSQDLRDTRTNGQTQKQTTQRAPLGSLLLIIGFTSMTSS